MLTFSRGIFTIIRSVVGWRAAGKIGPGRVPPIGPEGGRYHQGGPDRSPGVAMTSTTVFPGAASVSALPVPSWHTVSGPVQYSRNTRARPAVGIYFKPEIALKLWAKGRQGDSAGSGPPFLDNGNIVKQ